MHKGRLGNRASPRGWVGGKMVRRGGREGVCVGDRYPPITDTEVKRGTTRSQRTTRMRERQGEVTHRHPPGRFLHLRVLWIHYSQKSQRARVRPMRGALAAAGRLRHPISATHSITGRPLAESSKLGVRLLVEALAGRRYARIAQVMYASTRLSDVQAALLQRNKSSNERTRRRMV